MQWDVLVCILTYKYSNAIMIGNVQDISIYKSDSVSCQIVPT